MADRKLKTIVAVPTSGGYCLPAGAADQFENRIACRGKGRDLNTRDIATAQDAINTDKETLVPEFEK